MPDETADFFLRGCGPRISPSIWASEASASARSCFGLEARALGRRQNDAEAEADCSQTTRSCSAKSKAVEDDSGSDRGPLGDRGLALAALVSPQNTRVVPARECTVHTPLGLQFGVAELDRLEQPLAVLCNLRHP